MATTDVIVTTLLLTCASSLQGISVNNLRTPSGWTWFNPTMHSEEGISPETELSPHFTTYHGFRTVPIISVDAATTVGYQRPASLQKPMCKALNVSMIATDDFDEREMAGRQFLTRLVEDDSYVGSCPSTEKSRMIHGKLVDSGQACLIQASYRQCDCVNSGCWKGHDSYTCIPVWASMQFQVGGCIAERSHHVSLDCICGIKKASGGKDFHTGGVPAQSKSDREALRSKFTKCKKRGQKKRRSD